MAYSINVLSSLKEVDKFTVGASLTFLIVIYSSWRIIYNLYFHPLAGFPGPWWTHISCFAEFYYDVVLGGQFFKEIKKMHEKYGPIIRIDPENIHINDPYFYDSIYASGTQKRNKDKYMVRILGGPTSVASTIDHDHHRLRRAPLNSFFSKQSIVRLEPLLQSKVHLILDKFKEAHRDGRVIATQDAYAALTADVISSYAYGESFGYLDKPDFNNEILQNLNGLLLSGHYLRFFPLMIDMMKVLPRWMLKFLNPKIHSYFGLQNMMDNYAVQTLEAHDGEASRKKCNKSSKHQTVFEALVDPSMPPEERTRPRLADEGLVVIAAGMETTARVLTILTYHLTENPQIRVRLRSELETVMKTPDARPSWQQLESLPYMAAVINEGLRINTNNTSRFPRVPQRPLQYKDWVIPAGTSVSAIPWIMNYSPEIFPDPHVFRPERWIEAQERGENLSKYLTSFTKGSRICLGINLAYAELYLMTAALVRNFDIELVDSTIADITAERDFGIGFNWSYKFGIRIRITKVLDA